MKGSNMMKSKLSMVALATLALAGAAQAAVYMQMDFENQSGAVGATLQTTSVVPGWDVNDAGNDAIIRGNYGYPTGTSSTRAALGNNTMGFTNNFAQIGSHNWGSPGVVSFSHANGYNAPFAGSDSGLQSFSADLSISSANIVGGNTGAAYGPRIQLTTAWQSAPNDGFQTVWTLQLRNSGTDAAPVAQIDLSGDGGATWNTLAPAINPNQVYHVDVVMDFDTKTMQGFINGNPVLASTAMNAGARGFIDFSISGGHYAENYSFGVDNFVLQSGNVVPEPTTLALLGLASVSLLSRRKRA